jgi:hypothetical protein
MGPHPEDTYPGPSPAPGEPGTRWKRLRLPLGLLALLIILLGGYAFATRSSSPKAAPTATPQVVAGSETPSPAATPSVSASVSASPSAKPSSAAVTKSAAARTESGGWPNASNTGVPPGTDLTTYHGPCEVTKAGTVIDAKTVNCDLVVRAANVMIKRSKINGVVLLDSDVPGSDKWSYTLADSEVDAGVQEHPAVSYGNMTVLRSNIHGGATSVQCGEHAISCTIEDSWLHGQQIPINADWHLGGFLSNGGHNIRIRHNRIVCDTPVTPSGEGCTGDLNLFGDFAVITDVIVSDNFLGANTGASYCIYGGDSATKPYPHANRVTVTGNVFERGKNNKCGAYGPVSTFNSQGVGNVWENNTWSTGGHVNPED